MDWLVYLSLGNTSQVTGPNPAFGMLNIKPPVWEMNIRHSPEDKSIGPAAGRVCEVAKLKKLSFRGLLRRGSAR
jgi:hypothetical protein